MTHHMSIFADGDSMCGDGEPADNVPAILTDCRRCLRVAEVYLAALLGDVRARVQELDVGSGS